MGHLVNSKEEVYFALAERLNKSPVGAPISANLMAILKQLYSESEAILGSRFPLLPMTLEQIIEITRINKEELLVTLESMAKKGLIMDVLSRKQTFYILSPMVVGFFEYTFMRTGESNLPELAELFKNYFEDPAVADEFFGSSTKLFKTLVYEQLIPLAVETEVLDYEKASEIIRSSGGGSLGICSCRHKAKLLGTNCDAPIDNICTSLGRASEWLIRRGFAQKASVDDMLRNLERSEKLGLVLLGDNVLNKPAYICHCCGCCCNLLKAINKKDVSAVHPSNFTPTIAKDLCIGCEVCVKSCHINVITMQEKTTSPVINEDSCIGCGVCAAACPTEAIKMLRKSTLYTPPKNKMEQMMRMGVEKNRF